MGYAYTGAFKGRVAYDWAVETTVYLRENAKRMGYSIVGEFHKCGYKFNRWYNMVWMEKTIGEHPDKPEIIIPFSKLNSKILANMF